MVVVVEDRAEDEEGERGEIGRDGWEEKVVMGGRGGGVTGEEKWRAREGLVYVTLSGRVGMFVFVGFGIWEEGEGEKIWEEGTLLGSWEGGCKLWVEVDKGVVV